MASVFEARKDYKDFKLCVQSNKDKTNFKEVCAGVLKKAIHSTSEVISRECLPHTEDLYKCFKHSFRLSFCDKNVTDKLKHCQLNMYKLISS